MPIINGLWLEKLVNIKLTLIIMKNCDPVESNRQKWYDVKNTKNKPHSCQKDHKFCNFEYEWAKGYEKMNAPINLPISSGLSGLSLPKPSEKGRPITYSSITQQNLDDWIAQSMNRSIGSMINHQNKFNLPSQQFQKDLRKRHKKNEDLKKGTEDDTYFGLEKPMTKSKGYLSKNQKKSKITEKDLVFDFRKLEPHQDMGGTPIKINEMKKLKKKQIIRRNAVLLNNDIHYARFLKQFRKDDKEKSAQYQTQGQTNHPIIPLKNVIYSFNLDSMRRSDCYEDVPTSIIEKQYERIKAPTHDFLSSQRALMNKQEQLHEKYRELMNEKTKNAINTIKEVSNKQSQLPSKHILGGSTQARKKTTTKQTINQTEIGENKSKYQKSTLKHKITKLLNDMQVQSETIDENMSKLCIHPDPILLRFIDDRKETKWILKAQQKIKEGQTQLAIDCYKQAVNTHAQEFLAIFNIAVLLQKQNMFETSKKWFIIAQQMNTDPQKVAFGLSIVKLKQKRFTEALSEIGDLINKLQQHESSPEHNLMIQCYYIRALCHKELLDYKLAKEDYKKVEKAMIPSNYNILPDFVFSVVFSKVRRIPLCFNSLSYMMFKEAIFVILYENSKKVKQNSQKVDEIAEKLITKPFFNRFSLKLINKLLAIAHYQEYDKNQLIFCHQDKTSIILNGLVSLKSHEKNIERPNIITVLNSGGIIGAGQLENGVSMKPNNWFSALSRVQLITVPRSQFQMFWKGQITFQWDFKYNFLKNIQLLRGLSEKTLFNLCQLFKVVKYQKGAILFNDCSYRNQIINKAGTGYGLAKPTKKTDPRFVTSSSNKIKDTSRRSRGRAKIFTLIKKHIFKFNEMKFSRLKYPGLFIVKSGQIQIEDDKGFRCSGIINSGEFFGECLVLNTDGFHKYGRMVVESDEAELYLLELDDLIWQFSQYDKKIMQKNCEKRQSVETVSFLRNRHNQCLNSKFSCKRSVW